MLTMSWSCAHLPNVLKGVMGTSAMAGREERKRNKYIEEKVCLEGESSVLWDTVTI